MRWFPFAAIPPRMRAGLRYRAAWCRRRILSLPRARGRPPRPASGPPQTCLLFSLFSFPISNFCVFSEILDSLRGSPEGILLRLQPERIFERRLAALREQRIAGDICKPVQLQQPVFGITLRLNDSAAPQ